MPVPTSITDLQANESLNSPQGGDQVGGKIDDFFRAHAAIIKRQFSKGADINSAATLPIPADGSFFNVVKSAVPGILGFADNFVGRIVYLKFEADITLTHSTSLIMPSAANVVTLANDVAVFVNESAGVWRCVSYLRLLSDAIVAAAAVGNAASAALTTHKSSADHDGRYYTKPEVDAGLAGKQSAGSYAPASGSNYYVQSDANNKIKIDWQGQNSRLDTAVNNTYIGHIWYSGNFNPETKANTGSQVVHAVGVTEFGNVSEFAASYVDLPSPWVLAGLRGTGGGNTSLFLRGVWLRNQ